MLVESRLYAGKEHIHGLLRLGAGCLAGDMEQADNRILEVVSFPVCPGTITPLALRSMKWVFFHNGPLSREGSYNSSVLTHFEDLKQGGSLTCMGV